MGEEDHVSPFLLPARAPWRASTCWGSSRSARGAALLRCRAPANLRGRGRAMDARRRRVRASGSPSRPFGPRPGVEGSAGPTRALQPRWRPSCPRLPGPHLLPQLSHLFRSARRHRRLCSCRRPLPGPPWCSDDALRGAAPPSSRLGFAGPRLPGPRPRQVSGLGGRRKEGASAREPAAACARRAPSWAGTAQPLQLTRLGFRNQSSGRSQQPELRASGPGCPAPRGL